MVLLFVILSIFSSYAEESDDTTVVEQPRAVVETEEQKVIVRPRVMAPSMKKIVTFDKPKYPKPKMYKPETIAAPAPPPIKPVVVEAAPIKASKPIVRKEVEFHETKEDRTIASTLACGYIPSQADKQFDTRTIKKENLIEKAPSTAERMTTLLDQDPERKKSTWPVTQRLSLQQISKKIFGTTQRWREIYILNYAKLKSYDRVPLGTDLTVYEFVKGPCAQ